MTYVQLFFSFLLVGLFSVGGGYAAIPLIQAQVVEAHGWLTMAGVHQPCHHCRNDARPHCRELGHLCGHSHCGRAGRRGGHAGVHFPGAYSGVGAGVSVPALPKRPRAGQRAELPAPGGGGADCGGGPCHAGHRPCWAAQPRRRATCEWASAALFCAALVLLRWRKWNPILVMCLCGAASLALGAAGLVPV